MPMKQFLPAAALLVLGIVPAVCLAQETETAGPESKPAVAVESKPAAVVDSASAATARMASSIVPASTSSAAFTDPYAAAGSTDYQQPRITTVNPPPAPPASWALQDRLKWLAEMLLVLIASAGVWLGFSTLRKIEQQTRYSEEAAQAAADAAKAALMFAENQAKAERPWLLVTASPVPGGENSFSVVATNRGRSPARVASLAECIAIVHDESELPRTPIYKTAPRAPAAPTVLLPGESVSIRSFSRDEVKSVCENPDEAQRIEEWQEKIYLYGNVVYSDLTSTSDSKYETGWCCWYIHGRQKSGMIMAGPPEYNRHT